MTNRLMALAAWFSCVAGQCAVPASVWDGIYSSDQAQRGAAGYRTACASCHGDNLDGTGQNPPLSGPDFTSNWNGMSVGDLFEKIQVSMPADRPGKLSRIQNAEILAYILKVNAFPAGNRDLTADAEALKSIQFQADKPK
jgi:S-disulfanyl-L-cysteine oxidoreductase SoxD